ncbi:MAG: serine hydroxymethyltransferase [Gemmatimonadetes bacterium]|nr:serine hydroxymethyltransferase [Gemmatimonadota bacterium]
MSHLEKVDPRIHELVQQEAERQEGGLELIASENFVSLAVLEAMGSGLTNKYAEGYPGRRYYGGCEVVDKVESLAIERACELFGAEHANVQPHSGAQANMAAFLAVADPGDTIMGMSLTHGGHLTHGASVNASGRLFRPVQYGVDESTGLIDIDQVRELALKERPALIIAGGSAYPRVIDFEAFRAIADDAGSVLIVDMAHFAGLVAGGCYPSPVPHAQIVTSTTHKTLRGPRGGLILCTGDYSKTVDKQVFPGTQGGPLEHVIAAKAVAFHEAMQPDFKQYAARVVKNAQVLGDSLQQRGFTLVSGGTDSHLLLIDLRAQSYTGKEAEEALGRAEIHINKNTIPGETRSPFITSGIRIGTSGLTTRGMGEAEMKTIGEMISDVLSDMSNAVVTRVTQRVQELTEAFPLYRDSAAPISSQALAD